MLLATVNKLNSVGFKMEPGLFIPGLDEYS